MARSRVAVSQPFRMRQKRQTIWVASADITSATVLGAGAVFLDQTNIINQATNPTLVGSTIIRTRGIWAVSSDQAAASENYLMAMGMGVVTAAAAAAGSASIPTPIIEEEWDGWFVYEVLGNSFLFADGTGFQEPVMTIAKFDSKGQRKVEDDNTVVVVVENSFTVGITYWIKFRQLYKLA